MFPLEWEKEALSGRFTEHAQKLVTEAYRGTRTSPLPLLHESKPSPLHSSISLSPVRALRGRMLHCSPHVPRHSGPILNIRPSQGRCPPSGLTVDGGRWGQRGKGSGKELAEWAETSKELFLDRRDLESPLGLPLSCTWLSADSRQYRALVSTEALEFTGYGPAKPLVV